MKWNWQLEDWPLFIYKSNKLEELERKFLHQSGFIIGAFQHLNENDKSELRIELISNEAFKTSQIEGEYLNRDSLQSSIRRHFGISDNRKVAPAEKGIGDMMIDLHENYDKKLSDNMLFNWHKMLCLGRYDLKNIGSYRTHEEPMEVISGPMHKPTIHFQAPPSASVQYEMDRFTNWFQNSENSPLIKSSIAHLYFVCIHPFEDGNGRIGRAVAQKSLAESLGYPTLIALSQIIEKNKKSYYEELEIANKSNEITRWIEYFSNVILQAQEHTKKQVEFLLNKAKFFEKFKSQLNERQEKVILRIFTEGYEGFKGGLSADNYIKIANTSRATATRDLQDLIRKNIFTKTGELKSTRYYSIF